ncbi:gamma-glutamyl-gamma-aminobutyrate hydrolase family protein [Microtetraspora glauca]|uniref:Gamma-glutamyl-gamma-aminobutyrate hydrolase family protein n=1 Tax=Microtetraspora glauca TaxID=1996 RepID=A0ABV3GSS4_MICGL
MTTITDAEAAPVVLRSEVDPGLPRPARPGAHIAVLVSLNFPDLTDPVADLVRRFTRTALRTLVEAGATYELFDTSEPSSSPERAAEADGVLLLGGGDIDGAMYGCPGVTAPNSYGVDARADRDSVAAVHAAVAAGRPVLGICRGSQLINVAFGGTILPDIEDYRLHRGGPGEPMFLDERVSVIEGTRLMELTGGRDLVVRSGHHQAVDRLGDGLRVAARALDGLVEAVEHTRHWVVGVQWHPEDPDGPPADRDRLFRGFVGAAARGVARTGSEERS